MKKCLDKYAELIIKKGVNLQPDQPLIVNAPVTSYELVRRLCKKAYEAGACEVYINWKDDLIKRYDLEYQSEERLSKPHSWFIDARLEPIKEGAAVAEIMTMAETLLTHPEIKHGRVAIAFTCDEEVGRGADDFDLERFACDYAYTVDGGDIDCIDYENFNAAAAVVTVHGKSIHPGSSKNKMINAILVAYEFHNCLNVFENPACTEGYDGFNHMTELNGGCEKAVMHYIIRNHDEEKMAHQKAEFENARDFLNKKYGYEIIELAISDSYANMRQCIEKDMRCVDRAKAAMLSLGITPRSTAIRGGTDGARLTYDGLNCPNLGTGGANYHGKYEFVSIQAMNKITELLVKIARVEA